MDYRKRFTDKILERKLNTFGAVLITGPKGCGKTTTAKQKAKSIIEFQDEDKRDAYLAVANNMPSKLLVRESVQDCSMNGKMHLRSGELSGNL